MANIPVFSTIDVPLGNKTCTCSVQLVFNSESGTLEIQGVTVVHILTKDGECISRFWLIEKGAESDLDAKLLAVCREDSSILAKVGDMIKGCVR